MLEVSYEDLTYYLYRLGDSKYRSFSISKRQGGSRVLMEPGKGLKIIQQKLNNVLKLIYKPQPAVHGFTSGRSIATNAQVHEGHKHILNIDLEDFFPSINFGRVRGMFIAKPYKLPPGVATVLAQICCFENQLPQGAPTSPIVSNMICSKMDNELQSLARRKRCIYSRYADDISISTLNNEFPLASTNGDNTLEISSELINLIEKNGFKINKEKSRLGNNSNRLEVTGLIVNNKVNVPRKYIRQIRAMLHAWEKYGLQNAQSTFIDRYDIKSRAPFRETPRFDKVLKGKLSYLAMVRGNNDPVYRKLLEKYASLNHNYHIPPLTSRPNHLKRFDDGVWVLESTSSDTQGTGFYLAGYGLVTCAHVITNDMVAFNPLNPLIKHSVSLKYWNEDLDLATLDFDAGRSYEFIARFGRPRIGEHLTVAGFPNYSQRATLWRDTGPVTGFRDRFDHPRILIDCHISAGASGSPVFDLYKRVIGVASNGAPRFRDAHKEVDFGVIPISLINDLVNNNENRV
ncbi:MAG: reverse transcriptase domain-containing protein [Bacillota bacterium]